MALIGTACIVLAPALAACTPIIGGGVLLGVIAIGALTSHCYDYLDVTVFDGQGRRTCTATVTARNGGDHFELTSCYYAPLTDGVWTLSAALPGYPDAITTVAVDHAEDCTRHVQSVELSLNHTRSVAAPLLSVSRQSSAPASSAGEFSAPAIAPSKDPEPPAAPASSTVPPVRVFPETK